MIVGIDEGPWSYRRPLPNLDEINIADMAHSSCFNSSVPAITHEAE